MNIISIMWIIWIMPTRAPRPALAIRALLLVAFCVLPVTVAEAQTPPEIAPRTRANARTLAPITLLQDVPVDPATRAWADQLADPAYERREEAMDALLDGKVNVDELCAILQEPGLTSEQQYRLLMIVRRQLLTAPRGAVGIKVDQRWMPNLIIIEDLIAGLPAMRVLEIGDRITHLQGKELRSWNDFRQLVQSMAPGDHIRMTVKRPLDGAPPHGPNRDPEAKYEVKEVDLELGSADLLVDQDTGLPQPNNQIDRERLSAANEATRRYAPRAVTVEIAGASPDVVMTKSAMDLEIEANSHIQKLLREQALIARGDLELTRERQIERMRQLEIFKRLATDPGVPEGVRDMHRRLAERFAQLIGK